MKFTHLNRQGVTVCSFLATKFNTSKAQITHIYCSTEKDILGEGHVGIQ